MKKKRCGLIVAGPTGSGKSTYALKIAQKKGGLILNADSLQLYSGLPLLTAQPSLEDREHVPHFLYEIFDEDAPLCSAQKWVHLVQEVLRTACKGEQFPLLVGGTGFYLQALTMGLSPIPSVSADILQELAKRPLEELYRELECVDPSLAVRLKAQDRQRIIRGLSVWQATGKRLSEWQMQPRIPFPYPFEWKILLPDRLELHKRLEERLKQIVTQGAFEEVKRLMRKLQEKQLFKAPVTRALGFQEMWAFWEGHLTREEAIQKTLEKTRQYAKRQITWLKHQKF